MRVVVVPVLSDNYAYLLIDDASGEAACVDPAEAGLVMAAAAKESVKLTTVLTTHKHGDHAGGNEEMRAKVPGIEVVGGQMDNVAGCTKPVKHKDVMKVGKNITVECLHTPGHTAGSMSFYCTDEAGGKLVFTGDTMFVGGCGRLFEGTPQDLYNALTKVLGSLPKDTQVYVGHEYTVKNLEFAVTVDKENKDLSKMLQWAQEQRMNRKYTVPSTLQNEWLCNPFMRADDPAMKNVCPGCAPVDIFAKLREQKNNF